MALEQFVIDQTLSDISSRLDANKDRVTNSESLLSTASGDLGSMPSQFGAFITALEADATASPLDDVIRLSKETKDKYVTEFIALKATADAKLAASQGA